MNWLVKHQQKALNVAIFIYIVIFSAACLWKYGLFAYNGLDLAIFNNVFWQTAQGRLFEMTIHPHSYLGDHAGFGLLALVPFYVLWRDPQLLLILQTAALAITAWPIYLLARHFFGDRTDRWQLAPLAISAAWLLNPIVHNINLYEFHLLPFALPFLFLMLLAYERGQAVRFLVFALLAMLWREDVSFVVAAVGLLAAIEKKSWWWRVTPILFGAAWFMAAGALVAAFAPAGSYKFAIYYSWMIETPSNIFQHLISVANFEMLLGFGLPLLFLPFAAPTRLVLAGGPLLQILLSAPGGSGTILQTHYAVLFLPALFAALIAALKISADGRLARRNSPFNRPIILGGLLVVTVYGALTLGPITHLRSTEEQRLNAQDAQLIIANTPADEAVAASYSLLPHLSSRDYIYSTRYLFLGVQQFGTGPFELPPRQLTFTAVDDRELQSFRAAFQRTAWTEPYFPGGRERLSLITGPVRTRAGHFTLYGPPTSSFSAGPVFDQPAAALDFPQDFFDGTKLTAKQVAIKDGRLLLELHLELGPEPLLAKNILLSIENENQSMYSFEVPLINGLEQPIADGAPYILTGSYPLPKIAPGKYRLTAVMIERETMVVLNQTGSNKLLTIEENKNGHLILGTVVVD